MCESEGEIEGEVDRYIYRERMCESEGEVEGE